ncbi:MAG TPA: methyltransferase domain-containing protein [Candidatus Nanopelagicaceae bacterium]|nr:methyltransferase domain-containing protein [Candidatus Nanopelagicaceae bacterium]
MIDSNTRWAQQLASWAIPAEIMAKAPTSPWIHPVELFVVPPDAAPTVSPPTRLALEALPAGGSVLDIGCGGGRGAMALVERAGLVIGVDHQQEMLKKFAEAAIERNVEHQEIFGDWPANVDEVPIADVAIAYHVIYNVSDLAIFAAAIDSHARKRVVLEAPMRHPLANLNALWEHFWSLKRPEGPSAEDAVTVIRDAGYEAEIEYFSEPPRQIVPLDKQVEFTRIRLCLPETRDAEIREILINQSEEQRQLAAIWWDKK